MSIIFTKHVILNIFISKKTNTTSGLQIRSIYVKLYAIMAERNDNKIISISNTKRYFLLLNFYVYTQKIFCIF